MKLHTTADILRLYADLANARYCIALLLDNPNDDMTRIAAQVLVGEATIDDLRSQFSTTVQRVEDHELALAELNAALAAVTTPL